MKIQKSAYPFIFNVEVSDGSSSTLIYWIKTTCNNKWLLWSESTTQVKRQLDQNLILIAEVEMKDIKQQYLFKSVDFKLPTSFKKKEDN